MRLIDVLMAIPAMLMALALMTLVDRSVMATIFVIGLVYAATSARIFYGLTLKLKSSLFMDAARTSGVSEINLLLRQVLPNLMSPLIVQSSFIFAFAQLQAAALDFLGLGFTAGNPQLGSYVGRIAGLYYPRAVFADFSGWADHFHCFCS